MLADELRGAGVDPITTCEPGGTPLGRMLRQAFLETEDKIAPMAELLSFARTGPSMSRSDQTRPYRRDGSYL